MHGSNWKQLATPVAMVAMLAILLWFALNQTMLDQRRQDEVKYYPLQRSVDKAKIKLISNE